MPLKFTEKGEVVVLVSTLEGGSERQRLQFAVRDTGIGIPEQRLDKLFQAFSQVDSSTTRRYGGTGLGLAISKRLSELMGGEIWVESEVGVGTTFYFTITAETAADLKTWAHLKDSQAHLAGKRLLVVDDNDTNRRILSLQTQGWGMLCRDTAAPLEALGWIERGDPFDLAILGLQMPQMDGLALAQAIRELRTAETLPLILFSSLGSREDTEDKTLFIAHPAKTVEAVGVV